MELDIPVAEHILDEDHGPCQVIADSLGLPEILRKIMQNFSTKELLELSLVNKQWNYEARSLMRIRGNLTARIIKYKHSNPLRAFASDLRRMKEVNNIVPLSGMTFHLGQRNVVDPVWLEECSAAELDPVFKDILDHVTWKHLSVTFLYDYKKRKSFSDLQCVQKILQNASSALEELSLFVRKDLGESVHQLLQDCSFPRLKILNLKEEALMTSVDFKLDPNLVRMLASRAPNLEVLCTKSQVDLAEDLLEGTSAMHVAEYAYTPGLDEISESVVGRLRMQQMKVIDLSWDFNVEKFIRITPMLLQTCQSTLCSIRIHAIFLPHLMQFGICLENVKAFEMILDYSRLESIQPRVLSRVKSFDFTRIFPQLNGIDLHWPLSYQLISVAVNRIVEHRYPALLMNPLPERAVNIKTLRLDWPDHRAADLENASGRFLAQMFPDVQRLEIRASEVPFSSIWDAWVDLKELEVTFGEFAGRKNYDSVFCGIFPEEVAELRQMDDEYLRLVNIVPVMPAITCLKGLRTFNYCFRQFCSFYGRVDDPTYAFSKVTGLIAFKRCPGLTVTFRTDNLKREQALSHLKPYASVILDQWKWKQLSDGRILWENLTK